MLLSFHDPVPYAAKTVNKKASSVLMTNIFKDYKEYFDRVAINYRLVTYYIQGAPRPETLAYELYGNVQLYWVLLMCNNIYDPYHEWIKPQEACYQSVDQQYENAEDLIAYHVNIKGEKFYNLVQDQSEPGSWYDKGDEFKLHKQYVGALNPVTVYEDAILENERKRQIKIIAPSDIESFLSDLIREMEIN